MTASSPDAPKVGIIMGSQSDWPTMRLAAEALERLKVPFEAKIVSAHRTPERLFSYAKSAKARGLTVIIVGQVEQRICQAWSPRSRRCPCSGYP